MKKEEIETEYQKWHKEDEKLEKTKYKRVIQALLIFALLYFFIFSASGLEKTTDILGLIIVSVVMSCIDIFVHTIVYSFTLTKNHEDSIHLKYWKIRIEEKENRLAENKLKR